MRAGDVVMHKPTGEEWVVAAMRGTDQFYAAGWPETLAAVADIVMVDECDDAEHRRMLEEVASSHESSARRSAAQANLDALNAVPHV